LSDSEELRILEEELHGITNTVSKAQERLNIVSKSELLLLSIQNLLNEVKMYSLESYNTKYDKIIEIISKIDALAKQLPYDDLHDFEREEIIPQGAISYNFKNITYFSIILSQLMPPPLSSEELIKFTNEIDSRYSSILLHISQLKSYKNKLEAIIDHLSVTAIACYLGS
jgi:hypothetical protein